jgi:glycerophosphoryl diester phosphodiesterase
MRIAFSRLQESKFFKVLGAALLCFAGSVQAFDLQAHRGGRGLHPENTLTAFESAARLGVTTLELDIGITADGVPVVSHDRALNPFFTRDARGEWLPSRGPLINALSLSQLQTYDVGRLQPGTSYAREFNLQQAVDGERVPTLAAVFERVKALKFNHLHFNIETKLNPNAPDDTLAPEPFVRAVLEVIRQGGMTERVMLQSFDWRTLEVVHQLSPDMRTAYLTATTPVAGSPHEALWTAGRKLSAHGGSMPKLVRAAAGSAKGVTWSPHWKQLDLDQRKQAKALGLSVVPWTVNETADMKRLMDWGVDGLITDYPDRLRAVMAERGMALPR